MINKLKALLRDKNKLREVGSYLLFGVLTTLVSWLVYVGMTALLGLDGQPAGSAGWRLIANASNVTSWVLAVSFAYITNKRFVFKSRQRQKAMPGASLSSSSPPARCRCFYSRYSCSTSACSSWTTSWPSC